MAEESRSTRWPLLFLLGTLAGAAQLILLWATSLPLGVPGEWTWNRISEHGEEFWKVLPALLGGTFLALYVLFVARRVSRPRTSVTAWLWGLWGLGTIWVILLVSACPGPTGLGRAPFVLFYPRSSGYLTQARGISDLQEFLEGYKDRIADQANPDNYLHLGTHPPGLTTLFVEMLRACKRWPALTNFLLATRPSSVRESMEIIRRQDHGSSVPFRDIDAAVLWLATLCTAIAAAGTCVPIYLLARRTTEREAAWWGAAVWLLVPAVGIFLPKSDVMFPFLATWAQWLWLQGVDRRSVVWGLAAGGVLFLSLCLSLAFAPLGLMMVLQGLWPVAREDSRVRQTFCGISRETSRIRVYVGAFAAFVFLVGACGWLGQINLLAVWVQNLKNHAAFYSHHTRTYWPWLLLNPVELGFAVGLPVMVVAGGGLSLLLSSLRPVRWDLLIPCLVWGLLWISGKNMGEAARLWIFLMPYLVWLWTLPAGRMLPGVRARTWITAFFLLQLVVCLLTVVRIDGFQFSELVAAPPLLRRDTAP